MRGSGLLCSQAFLGRDMICSDQRLGEANETETSQGGHEGLFHEGPAHKGPAHESLAHSSPAHEGLVHNAPANNGQGGPIRARSIWALYIHVHI